MTTTTSLHLLLLLALLSLLLLPYQTVAYTPVPLGIGALLFQPRGIKTRPCLGQDSDILHAADFFTDAFWTAKIGGGAKQLSERQRKSLYNSQLLEFKRRYGMKLGDRRAELLLCENGKQQLMGVAAVEVETIPAKSLSSSASVGRAPLMSNVAVSRKFRRRGIAEILVKEIEELVQKKWGYDDIYLYVEQRNKPAIRLYQKLGYKRFWVDPRAKTLVPTKNGSMQNESTTIVCMKKKLNGNFLTRLFS